MCSVILSGAVQAQDTPRVDPTRPGQFANQTAKNAAKPVQQQFKLSAVFFARHNPQAVINGMVVGIGYRFDELEVKSIQQDEVVLSGEINGEWRRVSLSLHPSSNNIKTRSAENY